jgi:hypothetical protein
MMVHCLRGCEGLCCRRIALDDITGLSDFIYLLGSQPSLLPVIRDCLKKEDPLFAADCIFLKDGKGPCILPANTRPEVCITTFCSSCQAIRKEIAAVKWRFFKLSAFIHLHRFKRLVRWFRVQPG